jgi:hypothetical protein
VPVDLIKQIEALVSLFQNLGGIGGILVGLWFSWTVFKEFKKFKNGDHEREIVAALTKVTDTQVRIVEMLHDHSEGEMAALQRMADAQMAHHVETMARLSDLRVDMTRRSG